jgi:MoxR-like ATPase
MAHREAVLALQDWLNARIIGQERLVDRLLVALLSDGHLLVEGAPGLAKTRAIKDLSAGIEGDFHRIQFTPDLLPSDVTGTEVFHPASSEFTFQRGPIFHNLLLADEINRAPAKVQSALLEAMAEHQVSVGRQTFPLPDLFLVMATQNPIEQEGTYPLPEAQLDRFLLHVRVDYPDADAERRILRLVRGEEKGEIDSKPPVVLAQEALFGARAEVLDLHMAEAIETYIVQLVLATRRPEVWGDDLAKWIEFGASPRGSLALDRCSRAHAWLAGREFVTPDDVQAVFHDALRHRVLVTFEAEAAGVDSDRVLDEILDRVPVA